MPSYTIERALGNGVEGMVFLVKNKDGKQFAMKAYRRCDEAKFALEQEFNKNVVRKHPGKFMRIIQSQNVTIADKDLHYLPEGTCHLVVYEAVDRILTNLMTTLPKEALYSIIIQLIDATRVMHDKGYVHGDLHPGNVGLVFTENQEVTLSDKTRIPTHGYQVKLVDYGMLRRVADRRGNRTLVNYEASWMVRTLICPWDRDLWTVEHDTLVKNPAIMKSMLDDGYDELLSEFTRNRQDKILLMRTLFPHEYMKRVFGRYPRRKFSTTLPMEDLIFTLRADKNQELLMQYFRQRLAQL